MERIWRTFKEGESSMKILAPESLSSPFWIMANSVSSSMRPVKMCHKGTCDAALMMRSMICSRDISSEKTPTVTSGKAGMPRHIEHERGFADRRPRAEDHEFRFLESGKDGIEPVEAGRYAADLAAARMEFFDAVVRRLKLFFQRQRNFAGSERSEIARIFCSMSSKMSSSSCFGDERDFA